MFLAYMQLTIFSPIHIAVLFALVCKLSSVLCKGYLCNISFTKKSFTFVCYRESPGLCRPTSVTRRSDTGALPPNPGSEPGAFQDRFKVTHFS